MAANAIFRRLLLCAIMLILHGTLVLGAEAAYSTASSSESKSRFPTYFRKVIKAHGITGSTAWVLVLPIGAIAIRLLRLRGSRTFYIHAIIQTVGIALFIVNFGTGIYIAMKTHKMVNYHTVIGFIMFVLVWSQPVSGLVHHVLYKKGRGRTMSSHAHIWLGRVLITLGIIDGGLGLMLGHNTTRKDQIIYGVIAGSMWVAYVLVSVHGEVSGRRQKKQQEALSLTKEVTYDSQASVA